MDSCTQHLLEGGADIRYIRKLMPSIDAAEWIKADDPRQGALFVEALEDALTEARTRPEIYRTFDGDFRKV
ncbi:MAG: hypothetical protein L3J39_18725 [Verrucomicrobiales bacterium]|nr:hypothetical protein [Verrucomicrobiales bacterium]